MDISIQELLDKIELMSRSGKGLGAVYKEIASEFDVSYADVRDNYPVLCESIKEVWKVSYRPNNVFNLLR